MIGDDREFVWRHTLAKLIRARKSVGRESDLSTYPLLDDKANQ
jgi:hypothetical protein